MNHSEIVRYIENAGSDSLGTFGGTFEGGYHIQQNPHEFADLIEFITNVYPAKRFENYIEIGAAAGGAAMVLSELLNIGTVHIIDNNEHSKHVHRHDNLKTITHKEFIGDSHSNAAHEWLSALDTFYDFALIDGDHSYYGVRQDTALVIPYLNEGALVVYHDTSCVPEIKRFVKDVEKLEPLRLLAMFDRRQGIGLFERIK